MTKTDIANLALSKIGESLIDSITDTGDRSARLASLHYEPSLREILRAHFWGFAMGAGTTSKMVPLLLSITATGTDLPDGGEAIMEPVGDGTYGTDGVTDPGAGYYFAAIKDAGQWRIDASVDGSPLDSWTATSAGYEASPDLATWEDGLIVVGNYSDPTAAQLLGWTNAFTLPADFIKLRTVIDPVSADPVDKFDFRRINSQRCIVSGNFDSLVLDYVQYVDDPTIYDPLFVEAFATLLASKLARAITGSEAMESSLRQTYEVNALPAARTADGHDSQSNENHPLREILNGSLLGRRGDFFPELD